MKNILSLFSRKKKKSTSSVGVALCSDGLAVALASVGNRPQEPAQIEQVKYVSCGVNERHSTLKQLLAEMNIGTTPCIAVMPRGSYNLIQTELPTVPAEELRDAVRWQLRDLLDFPVEEAVIETISFSVTTKGSPLAFAIATQRAEVQAIVNCIGEQPNLVLHAIDIPELSLRSILNHVEGNEQGLALLNLWGTTGMVAIIRKDELCMARQVSIGLNGLLEAADPDPQAEVDISAAQQELLDEAILDIQRSLDFYESNVARSPVCKVLIAPLRTPLPGLVEYLDTYLNPEVSFLDLNHLLSQKQRTDQLNPCMLPAIGAALRGIETLP